MSFITADDGTQIFYQDWGAGQPVVFCHGWSANSTSWECQMAHMAAHGYRAIAHDRRGHGRSGQPWHGNHMDSFADDLAKLITTLDLNNIILVGHSAGGGEVVRYAGRHTTARLAKIVLLSAVPPHIAQSDSHPHGVPLAVFDGMRAAILADRSQFLQNLAISYFGANLEGAQISKGLLDAFWFNGMQSGLPAMYDGVKALSETDFTGDLKKIDVPTLIIHGDADQVVPIDLSSRLSAKLVHGSLLKIYPGAAHSLPDTEKQNLNADLLAFAKA